MNKKRKILFIDDGKSDDGSYISTKLEQRCKKFQNDELIHFDNVASNYFEINSAGTQCNILFPHKEYEFIFIHHSFNEPTLLPSNGIDLIKNSFSGILCPFSGGTQKPDEIFERQIVYDRLYDFLDFYQKYNKWMLYCFKEEGYKRKFAQELLEDLLTQISSDLTSFINSEEYQAIKEFVRSELSIYEQLPKNSKVKTIEFLRDKIEN